MTEVEDLHPLELRRLAADEPCERRVGPDDRALAVEHRLADRRRLERRAQERLGPLQRPAVLLELREHRHLGAQHLGIERFEHVVHRTHSVAAQHRADVVVRSGQEHDRHIARARPPLDQPCRFHPVELGHAHVEQDQGDVVLEQQPQRLVPRARHQQRVAERLEHAVERMEVLLAIVDDQDRQDTDRGQIVCRPHALNLVGHRVKRRATRASSTRAGRCRPAW